MEGYNEVENDACDAYNDATAGAAKGREHEERRHNMQMVRHVEEEEDADRGQLIDWGVFKPTSGNATKRLRMRQETRGTTSTDKTAEATLKQIATQEFQAEKGKMQIWKQMIMQEVAQELQTQKDCFRLEMEVVKEQLQEMEEKAARLEKEIDLFKAKEEKAGQHRDKDTPAIKKNRAQHTEQRKSLEIPAELIGDEEVRPSQSQRNENATPVAQSSATVKTNTRIERRDYATVAASRPAKIPEKPWTQVIYGSRKPKGKSSSPVREQLGRRILFPRNPGQEKSEADLMLALNEALQQVGEETYIRFTRVRYAPSGAISALLTEKADAGQLIPRRSNVLIRAVKAVDSAVVGIEVLEHWQRLKVHGMPLERYLGKGKMELLRREVESATGIQLKSIPRWLISESRLREQQESSNKRGSAIVITVSSESEAKKLCASGLRFGGIVKVVEKYWESGPSSVCRTCCGIGHERMGNCGNRLPKCVICAGPHKVEDHQCGVSGCHKKPGKSCVHVKVQCANCGGSHPADSNRCNLRHKAEIDARRKKTLDKGKGKIVEPVEQDHGSQEASPEPEMGMDLEAEGWAEDAEGENSDQDEIPEGIDHTQYF